MNFGYSRPHSTDSWRSRRPSFELSSRMHSVPRNVKSVSRPAAAAPGGYSSDYTFVDSPLYYMHRNDSSMSREQNAPPRNTGRASFDREDNFKYQQKQELQRKMVFNLHEEIEKPFLTTILEEISDPDRIHDICLSTLTSMMRSKNYRKFVHHMNNNAIPASPRFNLSHNHKFMIPLKLSSEGKKGAKDDGAGGSTKILPMQGRKKSGDPLPMNFEQFREQTKISHKKRQDEIKALEKLRAKLPPRRKVTKKRKVNETGEEEPAELPVEAATSRFARILDSMHTNKVPQVPSEESLPQVAPKKTVKPKPTAEETLKTKWLRLTDYQVADLENQMRLEGKEPGIHHFSTVETVNKYANAMATTTTKHKPPTRIRTFT